MEICILYKNCLQYSNNSMIHEVHNHAPKPKKGTVKKGRAKFGIWQFYTSRFLLYEMVSLRTEELITLARNN